METSPLPAAPSAVEVLALLTRVRSVRVAMGELDPSRLYDLRAFKTCWAELGYLHRLAAGGRHGGTAVTSMRQLVAGIAPLHPTWKLTGDAWEDRDRHHQSVRRRLSALAGAGLVRWSIGVDEDLEERRTELQLLPVPELLPDELAAAADRLQRWEGRYGPALNTHSPIGITNVKQAAAPLTASERQRRGCRRVRQAAQARQATQATPPAEASPTISSPPFGTPPTSENHDLAFSSNPTALWSVCDSRTRVHAPNAPATSKVFAAVEPVAALTAAARMGASVVGGPSPEWVAGILKRVAARAGVVALKESQVRGRAVEVAGWGLDCGWPVGRLREAWVVARHGVGEAALHGGRAAGGLVRESPAVGVGRARGGRDDYLTLRRAVSRYEANRVSRPEGFPAGGLAGLLHLGVLAREDPGGGGPMMLAYGVGALDHLSRRMRASATAKSAERYRAQVRRAWARRTPTDPAGGWRARKGGWPAWVVVDQAGVPLLELDDRFREVLVTRPGGGMRVAKVEREVLRDAIVLRYGQLPACLDGRAQMALRATGELPAVERRDPVDPRLLELAKITGLKLRELERFASIHIDSMLKSAQAQRRNDEDRARHRAHHDPSDPG